MNNKVLNVKSIRQIAVAFHCEVTITAIRKRNGSAIKACLYELLVNLGESNK